MHLIRSTSHTVYRLGRNSGRDGNGIGIDRGIFGINGAFSGKFPSETSGMAASSAWRW